MYWAMSPVAYTFHDKVDSSWNVMAHCDAQVGKDKIWFLRARHHISTGLYLFEKEEAFKI